MAGFRGLLYTLAKLMGDYNAVKKGKVGKRVGRRVARGRPPARPCESCSSNQAWGFSRSRTGRRFVEGSADEYYVADRMRITKFHTCSPPWIERLCTYIEEQQLR